MTSAALLSAAAFLAGFGPPISIFLANVGLGLFLAVWAWRLAAKREPFVPARTPFDAPLAAFLAAWAVAAAFGLDPARGFGKFPAQLRFIACYALLWASGGACVEKALRGYLWGAGAAVAYGLAQAALTAWLGGDTSAIAWLGPKGIEYATLRVGRVHGAAHPLTYAETLLPLFFFATTAFLGADGARRRILASAAVLTVGATLLLTQSRGPWLGAAAGLALIFALHPRRARLLPPLLLLALLAGLHPGLRERLATLREDRRDQSTATRLALWRDGAYIAKKNLFTGVGPGQLKRATEEYRREPDFPQNPYPGFESDMHNLYLQHLAERGLPGLAAILWLLFAAARTAWKAVRKEGAAAGTALAILAYFTATPVFNVTERALDDAEVALVFWVLAAVARRRSEGRSEAPGL